MKITLPPLKAAVTTALTVLCLQGCVSRMSHPLLIGIVTTPDTIPLKNVTVDSQRDVVTTDSDGRFRLPEHRYYAFLLKEIFYMHPPPVHVLTTFTKDGFQPCNFNYWNRYGGGRSKGEVMDIGTVLLQPVSEQTIPRPYPECTLTDSSFSPPD